MAGKKPAEYKGVAKFFTFLSSPEIQAEWHQKTGYVPITKAAYELTKKTGLLRKEPRHRRRDPAAAAEEPDQGLQGMRLGNFVQIRGIIDEELEAVWRASRSKARRAGAGRRGNERGNCRGANKLRRPEPREQGVRPGAGTEPKAG